MAEYAVEFGTLAAEAAWNEPANISAFHRGLAGPVHAALVGGLRPKDLDELIDYAIKIDNHQCERRREHVFCPTQQASLTCD